MTRLPIDRHDTFLAESRDVLRPECRTRPGSPSPALGPAKTGPWDADQFNIGLHPLCWVHAERLVHKLDSFTDLHRAAQAHMRALIWWFHADLKAYRGIPVRAAAATCGRAWIASSPAAAGSPCSIPGSWSGNLLARPHRNKPEPLMVLDRPEIPLHTNGSERDIRCQVIKRKISGGTHSDAGRDCGDAFLGLMHTCAKLGIGLRDYLGNRIGVAGQATVPELANLMRCRGSQPDSSCPGGSPGYHQIRATR